MGKKRNPLPGRDEPGISAVMLAVAAIALILSGVVIGINIGKSWSHGNGTARRPQTAESAAESGGEVEEPGGIPAWSTAESVAEAPGEETEPAPDLSGVADAAVPDVAEYAKERGNVHIVCIDPGHQDHEMAETEPNGPGSSEMKAKVTSGTQGVSTGNTEYEINLEIGLKLRDELERRGYTVVMTRETNGVELSNVDRAVIANEAGAEAFVRLHCNGSDDRSVRGALGYQPSSSNPYLAPEVIEGSQRLSEAVLAGQVASTGQNSLGLLYGDDMTGINWAAMPVTIIEMGFMSNSEEDAYLGSGEGQTAIAAGIADGIDTFFGISR